MNTFSPQVKKIAHAGEGETWDIFGFRLFSLTNAAPKTTRLFAPPMDKPMFKIGFLYEAISATRDMNHKHLTWTIIAWVSAIIVFLQIFKSIMGPGLVATSTLRT